MAYVRTAPLLPIASALLLSSVPALAAPPDPLIPGPPPRGVRFDYSLGPGTETCPTKERMHRLLISKFLYDPVKPDAGPRIEILVTRKGLKFHADINIYAASGKVVSAHQMEGRRPCESLLDDAAFDAEFGVSWKLSREPDEPPPPPKEPAPAAPPPAPPAPSVLPASTPSPPPPVPSPVRAAPAPPTPSLPPAPKYTFHGGVGTVVNFWLAPGMSLGGFGFLTWYLRDFLSISGEARGTSSIAPGYAQDRPPLRGMVIGGAVVPCLHGGWFFACGVFHLGWLQGSSDQRALVQTKSPWWFGIGIRPGFEWTFANRYTVRGFGELTGVTPKSVVVLNKNGGLAWNGSSVSLSVGFSIEAPLWSILRHEKQR